MKNTAAILLPDRMYHIYNRPNLFRVQKFTIKDYFFRHHLETTITNNNDLTWKRGGLNLIGNIIKVRINHLGKIVKIGE